MSAPLDDTKIKASPEVLQTITMMEVAERLAAMMDMMHREEPIGYVQSRTITVTDSPQEINLGTWVRATVFNNRENPDGSVCSPVYIYNTRDMPRTFDAPLESNESLIIDHKRQTNEYFYPVCASGGTAVIRIFYQ